MKVDRIKPTGTALKRSRAASPDSSLKSNLRAKRVPSHVSEPPESAGPHWTFLTNHAHVLVLLSRNPSLILREVALHVGITERAVQRIIADLEAGGIIEREKVGRQNHYQIRLEQPLRHGVEAHRTIGELLGLINSSEKLKR